MKNWESWLEFILSQLSAVIGWAGMDMWCEKNLKTGWKNLWRSELNAEVLEDEKHMVRKYGSGYGRHRDPQRRCLWQKNGDGILWRGTSTLPENGLIPDNKIN